MIEVTKEMVQLVYERIDFIGHGDDGIAEGLAAVLAIVERDHAFEVSKLRGALKLAGDSRNLWKQRATGAGWPTEEPARWRCNTTERCFREDGHDGPHGFAGQPS